ncbi:MAG TPA: OmpH family outer membrane protein [Pyrinomonadaceae bacterium]|nr:OmpH family outer membrane protein [Pyrinomonadaceae bacterium]
MRRIVFLLAACALLSVPVSAQTRPAATATPTPRAAAPAPATTPAAAPAAAVVVPQSKIAFVDTVAFADGATGIRKFVNAVRSVDAEFKDRYTELTTMNNRLKAIGDEITKLSANPNAPVSQDSIRAKNDEGARLERDLKYKKDQYDTDYERRYQQAVQPISSDIGRALDAYLTSHGLTLILDISKLGPAVLTLNPSMDITRDFIAEYNSKNP